MHFAQASQMTVETLASKTHRGFPLLPVNFVQGCQIGLLIANWATFCSFLRPNFTTCYLRLFGLLVGLIGLHLGYFLFALDFLFRLITNKQKLIYFVPYMYYIMFNFKVSTSAHILHSYRTCIRQLHRE